MQKQILQAPADYDGRMVVYIEDTGEMFIHLFPNKLEDPGYTWDGNGFVEVERWSIDDGSRPRFKIVPFEAGE